MIRIVLTLCVTLVCGPLVSSQELAPSLKLSIGTPKAAVVAAFGKPFEPFAVTSGDDNAVIGAPIGRWDVYHLTVSPDRMYVTIIHFRAGSNNGSDSAKVVDALMLMPAGRTTVSQILRDQPEFAAVCSAICDLVLVRNKFGNRSLLLRSKEANTNTVLYFEGDSAISKWASVTSIESVVSWAYELPRKEFEEQHKASEEQVVGIWSPGTSRIK